MKSFPLPRLNPLIRLYRGPDKADGTATWTLHHPISHKYFQIEWAEFECLSRMSVCGDAAMLIARVNAETILKIDLDDIKTLMLFLQKNGLLDARAAAMPEEKKQQPLWKKALHNYLFFSLVLLKPEKFLDRLYPFAKPLLSRNFLGTVYAFLVFLILLTLQRWDEFTHTFINMVSLEGAILLFVTLMGVKIIHEFGHALAARHYGVAVPHMGVAFMVMYPVFYTETSAAWTLQSRKARMHIGLAGIMTELVLATIALALWHILPPGPLQSLAFAVVAIALVGSLAINLNPLMRFDGYFIFSDWIGIENLHARSFSFAKHWIRKTLWGLDDPLPEAFTEGRARFLTVFGLVIILYRFFLFLGIALLVYWLFFKPLGLILMIVELLWFIGTPLGRELRVWWDRRADIILQKRAKVTGAVMGVFLILIVLPVQGSVSIPAIVHAGEHRVFYPPETALIERIDVREGQSVKSGEILMVLSSPVLERDVKTARKQLEKLLALKRIQSMAPEEGAAKGSMEEEIVAAQQEIADLEAKKSRLILSAPFDGEIRSLAPDLRIGLNIPRTLSLFHLIKPGGLKIAAYVRERDLARLELGQSAYFRPGYALWGGLSATLSQIDPVNASEISWPELSSLHGGPIASELDTERRENFIKPRESLTLVQLDMDAQSLSSQQVVTKGYVKINAGAVSPLLYGLSSFIALIRAESGLN